MANLNDPISDMLTRIRNAALARHARVEIPGSKMKYTIAEIFNEYGYIGDVEWKDEGPQGKVVISLKYDTDDEPMITNMERVSRPSRRVYVGVDEIPSVLNGLGIAIMSTSHGVITDREARAENVGGEVVCTIY